MIDQLGVQIVGLQQHSLIQLWSRLVAIRSSVKLLGGLRVSTEQEVNGLDLSEHEETGYSL